MQSFLLCMHSLQLLIWYMCMSDCFIEMTTAFIVFGMYIYLIHLDILSDCCISNELLYV